jgi:GT2 family glycosyltransferase
MALTRRAFDRIGGFDAEHYRDAAAEDRDLCDRALAAGIELRPVPAALVDHYNDLTLATLWRQHQRYGRGALTLRRSRRHRGEPPHPVAPGYYLALARAPRAHARGAEVVRLGALVATTQVAYATGYVGEVLRTRAARP